MKMKKSIIIAVLFAVISLLLCVSVFASEADIYSANIAVINESCEQLNAIMEDYAEADSSVGKAVAIRTSTVIVDYYNKINNLRADERVSREGLSEEIELLYLKGRISGACAWIYESHIGELGESGAERVKACYSQTLSAISAQSDPQELRACEQRYTSDISVAVYTEKIGMLYTAADSTEVAVIAAGAIEEIKEIGNGTLIGVSYEEIYQKVKKDISVQRIRERAVQSFSESYDEIYGEGSYASCGSTDQNIAYFLYSVKKSSSVEEFNINIKDGIGKVLWDVFDGSDGEYSAKLLSEITDAVDGYVLSANESEEIAQIKDIFYGLDIRLGIANAKDELTAHTKASGVSGEIIDTLLLEYNADGGIFDLCSSNSEIALELGKGKICVDWIAYIDECRAQAREIFGALDFSDAEGRIEELYTSFESAIKSAETLEGARESFEAACAAADKLLSELKAEVYLVKHSYVLNKSALEINISDKVAIESAILEFGVLDAPARDKLSAEISDLADKYKTVCVLQIYSYFNSAEREGVAKKYKELIGRLEFKNSEDFIAVSGRILQKAHGALDVYDIYELYLYLSDKFNVKNEYKQALVSKRDSYIEKIYNIEHTTEAIEEKIDKTLISAELELCRSYSEGRIVALGKSGDSSAVVGLIEASLDMLRFADSTEELGECVERATLDVYKQRACEELYANLCGYNDKISELEYLKESDKNIKKGLNSEKYELAKADIKKMSDASEVDEICAEVHSYFETVLQDAVALDLEAAVGVYSGNISALKDEAVAEMRGLGYLSSKDISDIEAMFLSQLEDTLRKFTLCANIKDIEAEFIVAKNSFSEISSTAVLFNTENARKIIGERIGEKFKSYSVSEYTAENYKLIHDAYNSALSKLSASKDIDVFITVMEEAYTAMASVTSIFEETRAEMLRELKSAYEAIEAMSQSYPEGKFAEIQGIYLAAAEEIRSAKSDLGHEELRRLTNERIALMRKVKVEWISSGGLTSSSSGNGRYPAGYDVSRGGLWGLVFSSDGLDFDIKLNVSLKSTEKRHTAAIKSALKNSYISYVGEVPMSNAEIADILADSEIKGVFDIKLSREGAIYDSFSGTYRVKILLPDELRGIDNLKVVYISDDGGAEFYDAKCEAGFLVFETSHFSEFIITGEKKVNLAPVIIILGILAIVECVALIIMKFLYESEKATVWSVAPISAMSVIVPRGGAVIVSIISIVDIALGVYIAIMAVKLFNRKRERRELSARDDDIAHDFGDERTEDEEVILEDEYDAQFNTALEGAKSAELPCLPALLDSVSAEEADSLISDKNISSMIVVSETNSGICRGCKKTFVNIDTISDNFSAGDTVSLKELKEKRLIPQSACYLKILARGVLDKPLVIKAQSFSNNAVKMIALTGGTAVLEGGSEI